MPKKYYIIDFMKDFKGTQTIPMILKTGSTLCVWGQLFKNIAKTLKGVHQHFNLPTVYMSVAKQRLLSIRRQHVEGTVT